MITWTKQEEEAMGSLDSFGNTLWKCNIEVDVELFVPR